MRDRIPTHPGRVQLTPVPGQVNTYDLVRADEPIEVGSALNKANLLPDSVCDILGIDRVVSEPKDAFLKIFAEAKRMAFAVMSVDAGTSLSIPFTRSGDGVIGVYPAGSSHDTTFTSDFGSLPEGNLVGVFNSFKFVLDESAGGGQVVFTVAITVKINNTVILQQSYDNTEAVDEVEALFSNKNLISMYGKPITNSDVITIRFLTTYVSGSGTRYAKYRAGVLTARYL